jgi:hypothetical protein
MKSHSRENDSESTLQYHFAYMKLQSKDNQHSYSKDLHKYELFPKFRLEQKICKPKSRFELHLKIKT